MITPIFGPKHRPYSIYRFEPAEDISAYELARIMKMVNGGPLGGDILVYDDDPIVPHELARHFRCQT